MREKNEINLKKRKTHREIVLRSLELLEGENQISSNFSVPSKKCIAEAIIGGV